MILTVTLNTALDRVLLIDEFIPGQPVSATKEVVCVGGKGLDASVALTNLGVRTIALSYMAGLNGKLLEALVANYGIIPETVWVDGETRTSYVIAEAKQKRVSHINVGKMNPRPEHIEAFMVKYNRLLEEARWVILAGSIPEPLGPEIYGELTSLAHQSGVPVLIDCLNQPAVRALPFHPEVLKMNRDEFNLTFRYDARTMEAIQAAALEICTRHELATLIISCGADGMVAITPDGVYQVYVPFQEVVNDAGAGDAASAALTWRLSEGDRWAPALQWAGAVSAAAVLTEGTGEVRREEAERIYPEVVVMRKL